jgi:hypothetical protein
MLKNPKPGREVQKLAWIHHFWCIVMKKVSLDSDKVVVHILTTAYVSHYDQCVYVRDAATCEIYVSQLSSNHPKLY